MIMCDPGRWRAAPAFLQRGVGWDSGGGRGAISNSGKKYIKIFVLKKIMPNS